MSMLSPPTKRRHLAFCLAGSICLVFAPLPSAACGMALSKISALQIRQQAQSSFDRSSAVIDAEVISPMDPGKNVREGLTPMATLNVLKVYKGKLPSNTVPVVYISSCDISLEEQGQKVRIMLVGNQVYHADQGMNGAEVSDLVAFNREVDHLVGQPRGSSYAKFPGEVTPPDQLNSRGRAKAVRR